MIKRKFGDAVRAKTDTAMRNEVLAKILCHNLCCIISVVRTRHRAGRLDAEAAGRAAPTDDEPRDLLRFPAG